MQETIAAELLFSTFDLNSDGIIDDCEFTDLLEQTQYPKIKNKPMSKKDRFRKSLFYAAVDTMTTFSKHSGISFESFARFYSCMNDIGVDLDGIKYLDKNEKEELRLKIEIENAQRHVSEKEFLAIKQKEALTKKVEERRRKLLSDQISKRKTTHKQLVKDVPFCSRLKSSNTGSSTYEYFQKLQSSKKNRLSKSMLIKKYPWLQKYEDGGREVHIELLTPKNEVCKKSDIIDYLEIVRSLDAFTGVKNGQYLLEINDEIMEALHGHIDDLKRIGIIKTTSQVAFAHTLADTKELTSIFPFYRYAYNDKAMITYLKFKQLVRDKIARAKKRQQEEEKEEIKEHSDNKNY